MITIYGDDSNYDALIRTVYNAALVNFRLNDIFSIDLSFVDEETIRQLNLQSRGINKPTDVLSFPYINIKFPVDIIDYPNDIDPDTGKLMLGEIMLCFSIIKSQSEEYGTTLFRELAYMTVHGILHLFGYDHIDDEDRAVMRKKEEEILESIGHGEND